MATAPPILLMTRPRASSEGFVSALRDRNAVFAPVFSPLIDIVFAGTLPRADGLRGLVFTSARAASAWGALGGPTDLPAWCVGPATAAAAAAAGMTATAAGGDADALLALLQRERPAGPLLHARGRHARGAVARRLTLAGIETGEAVVYDQPERAPTSEARAALSGGRPVVAPVFSPRTAALLARLPVRAPLLVAAMSEAVVKALSPLHSRALRRAARPDVGAMLDCTEELLAQAWALEAGSGEV